MLDYSIEPKKPINYDDVLDWFKQLMIKRLNEKKRPESYHDYDEWTTSGDHYFFIQIQRQLIKLFRAIHYGSISSEDKTTKCVDIANFCMMIADNERSKS